MALPELPVEGQDPWYVPRTDWDNAVEAELEGRLSDASLSSTIANRTKQNYGLGLSPYSFGAVGDGVVDDGAALQAFFNYVTANDVGVGYVGGLFRSSLPLTMGAALTKSFVGKMDLTFFGTSGVIGLTIGGWANGYWQHMRLYGPSSGTTNYASKTWHTGLYLTNGTARNQFGKIEGGNWSFSLIATADAPANTTANDFGNIRAQDCGSGHRTANGSTRYGLTTTWSNPVNNGSSGSNAQSTVIDVATLPPQYVIDGFHGAVGSAPYMIRITDNLGKTRLHYIQSIDVANSKLTIFPWVDPATTPTLADYQWGGALYTKGSDSNVQSFTMIDAVRCGSALVVASLYGPVGKRIISQFTGAAVVLGASPGSAILGSSLSGLYYENNMEDFIYVARPNSSNVYNYIDSDYALNLAKTYVVSAPRVSGTFTDAPASQGFGGTMFAVRGRFYNFEKTPRNGGYGATQTIALNRQDMQVPLYGNTFTINVTLDLDIHRLFGYDTVQFLIASTTGGAPSGTITFNAPSGYTINGGAGPVVFSGLVAPTRYLFRFDTVAMNVVVFAI